MSKKGILHKNNGKLSKRKLSFAILLFCALIFVSSILVFIPYLELHTKNVYGYPAEAWMDDLDDNLAISDIIIPGTHNSAAKYSTLAFFTKCQWDSVYTQLYEGYRYLDIRLGSDDRENTPLVALHGDYKCRESVWPWSKTITAQDIADDCIRFLKANPSETIIFMVKNEGMSNVELFSKKLEALVSENPQYWLITNDIPTLGEARGKIVLINRFESIYTAHPGIDMYWNDQGVYNYYKEPIVESAKFYGYTLDIQDKYCYDADDKWNAFEDMLNSKTGSVAINFLTTKGTQAVGHPYYFAKELNKKLLLTDLRNIDSQWIITDFGSEIIARHIYEANLDGEFAGAIGNGLEGTDMPEILLGYVEDEFAFICLWILFMVVISKYNVVGSVSVGALKTPMLIVLALSIVDHLEAVLGMGSELSSFRLIFSLVGYILRPTVAYCLIGLINKNKRLHQISYVLLVLNVLIQLSALFCGVAFSFSKTNEFGRGPLGYSSHVLSFVFIAMLLVCAYQYSRSIHSREGLLVILCALVCVAAAVLVTLGVLDNELNIAIVISCTFFYMYLYIQESKRDSGTGALNRQAYYADLSKYDSSITALVIMDMNGLKRINDTLGHGEGDRALKTLASDFMDCIGKHDNLYRTGGDEFVILVRSGNEEYVRNLIESIKAKNKESGVSCSIGYSMRDPGDSIESLEKNADLYMYKDKRQYYENN